MEEGPLVSGPQPGGFADADCVFARQDAERSGVGGVGRGLRGAMRKSCHAQRVLQTLNAYRRSGILTDVCCEPRP